MPKQRTAISRFFASPEEILGSYLLEDEIVLYDDAPSLYAFLIGQLPLLVLITVSTTVAIAWTVADHHLAITGFVLVVLGVVLLYLVIKRASQWYTRYVLTNFRVMRMNGVLKRSNAWIPWVKVTDVRYQATFLGRLFGFATLSIDSANELSGLKELKDLRDPARCELAMVEAVRAKQMGSTKAKPDAGITELSNRLAELLATGDVTVSITFPKSSGPTPSMASTGQAVVVLDGTASGETTVDETLSYGGDEFDASRFD